MFRTLQRGQRENIIYPLISYRLLRCNLTFARTRESSFTSFRPSYPPSSSAVAAAAYPAPVSSIPSCSYHLSPTRVHGDLSDPSHRSNSDHVVIYCATVLFCRLVYSLIVKNPVSSLAATAEVYLHLSYSALRGSRPVKRLSTWV